MARTPTPAAISPSDIGRSWVDTAWLMRLEQHAAGLAFHPYQPRTSLLAGRQASRLRGRGLNFEELRGYLPGDDVRHIDWKASQRSGKALVRVYTEERDRPALLVVDQRISLFFGSQRAMKSVIAAEFAALAAWMALGAEDRVGGIVFDDQHIHNLRPLRSRSRVQELLGALARSNQNLHAASPIKANDAQLNRALEHALRVAAQDYLVCVISDFAGADARTQQLLRELAGHNDVVAAVVTDPLFQHIPQRAGRWVVTEGELQVELDFAHARTPVQAFFRQRGQSINALLRGSGVPVLTLNTEDEVTDQLRHFLGRRVPRVRTLAGMLP